MTTSLADAVPAQGVDEGIAWHYGDPLREQRVLTRRVGVIDRRNRDVLRVGGPDRLEWLHTICSQHLSDLADGDSTQALVLSPRGHVEQHWQLTELGGEVWIDTEPGCAASVLDYLEKMRFLKRVEPSDVSADRAVVSIAGPATGELLRAAGLPAAPPQHAVAPEDDPAVAFVRGMDWPAPAAADLVVARASVDALLERLVAAGAEPVGVWAFEALRVASGRPRLGFETDHRTIPHEVGWIGTAVHLNKGCYRGQETVARVQNLGAPPRRLVRLLLSGASDELPAPGTPVRLDGREVGFVGTAVQHFEDGPVALAVVKRSIPDGTTVHVGDSIASLGTTWQI
jgi:folate-binding protein YgfZ